jgi:hypothetical protein
MMARPLQGYTWPERGWGGSDEFEASALAELRETTTAIVARKQTAEEATTLVARLAGNLMAALEVGQLEAPPRYEPLIAVEVRAVSGEATWRPATVVDVREHPTDAEKPPTCTLGP